MSDATRAAAMSVEDYGRMLIDIGQSIVMAARASHRAEMADVRLDTVEYDVRALRKQVQEMVVRANAEDGK